MTDPTTLATLQRWASTGERFSAFTCYDASTARWLFEGGARVLLVGDSAAQIVLGLERGARTSLDFMAAIGGGVKRGAPDAFVMVDYPDDLQGSITDHAARVQQLAAETKADAIKVEGDAPSLVQLLLEVGRVPVVAHLTTGRRCCGGSAAPGVVAEGSMADAVVDAGAAAILLESMDASLVAAALRQRCPSLPILGCNVGDTCPGQVVMLTELLASGPGAAIAQAARTRVTA